MLGTEGESPINLGGFDFFFCGDTVLNRSTQRETSRGQQCHLVSIVPLKMGKSQRKMRNYVFLMLGAS